MAVIQVIVMCRIIPGRTRFKNSFFTLTKRWTINANTNQGKLEILNNLSYTKPSHASIQS